jgi:hypothetical protein
MLLTGKAFAKRKKKFVSRVTNKNLFRQPLFMSSLGSLRPYCAGIIAGVVYKYLMIPLRFFASSHHHISSLVFSGKKSPPRFRHRTAIGSSLALGPGNSFFTMINCAFNLMDRYVDKRLVLDFSFASLGSEATLTRVEQLKLSTSVEKLRQGK